MVRRVLGVLEVLGGPEHLLHLHQFLCQSMREEGGRERERVKASSKGDYFAPLPTGSHISAHLDTTLYPPLQNLLSSATMVLEWETWNLS